MELARRGFRIFAGIRREADGERLRVNRRTSFRSVLDVTNAAQIAAAAAVVGQAVGGNGLFGLVNNAGIVVAGPDGDLAAG